MKKHIRYIVALFFLTVSQTNIAQESTQRPISEILNLDGTLNLSSGISGSFDPTGYQMTTDVDGQPMFAPGDSNWRGTTQYGAFNGAVNAIVIEGLDIYVGGNFTQVAGTAANYIAKWNGSSWSAIGTGLNNQVTSMALGPLGIYVGGMFSTAGGISASFIAVTNGTTWSALGAGVNSNVNAIAVSGSNVYVGGGFTTAGGVSANGIARLNNGIWSSLGSGVNGSVYALVISGSDVYVGGGFTTAGGTAANNIAKWNGSTWSALGSGVNNTVFALKAVGSDVYAGGIFSTAGGVSLGQCVKWNGSSWVGLGSGIAGAVYAIHSDGTNVYVGGNFTTAGGISVNRIAKWDGSNWSAMGSGLDLSVKVITGQHLGSPYNLKVFVAGDFTTAGGSAAGRFVEYYNRPLYQPSNLISSNISHSSATLTWTTASGNPAGYLVLRRLGSSPTGKPIDDSFYSIAGTIGDANVAYIGNLNTFDETTLAPQSTYHYDIFSFNMAGDRIAYLTTLPLENSLTTLLAPPSSQPTNLAFSNITTSAMTLTWTASQGGASGYLVIRRSGASPTGLPTSGVTYTAGQTIGDGIVAYAGTNTTFTASSLSQGIDYFFDIFAYNGSGASINYLTSSPLEGHQAISAAEPSSQPSNLSFSNIAGTSMTLSWTAATGSPAGYLVLRRTGASPTGAPSDGVAYTAGQTIGDGTVAYSGSAATANLSGLTSATTYFFDILSYNGSGAATNYLTTSPLEGSQATVTSVAISSVTTNPTSATAGTDLTVTANVTGSSPTVVLYYGNWNQSVGDSLTDASSPFQFTIPASKVNSAGLWIRVKASNTGGIVFNPSSTGRTNLPVTSSAASVTTLISNGTFPSGVPLSNYVSISLPLNKPLNLTSLLGSQEPKGGVPTKWRLMAWDPVQSVFIDKTTMENGKGYFLIMREASTFLSNVSGGTTNDRTLFDSQVLTPGWNIIGWPLGFTGNLTVTNSSSIDPVWQLKGGAWSQDAQVKPFGAIAVKNKTAGNLTVSNVLSFTQSAKAAAESGWSLRMKAYAGERMDEDNFVGVRSASIDGYDETDASNPLNIGEYVNAYFKTNDPQAEILAFDMRDAQNDGHVWDMQVEHNTKESHITLRWEDLGLPSGFEAILVDIHQNKIINLKEQSEYTFRSREQNPFKIIVGSPSHIQAQKSALENILPKAYALSQNYPNPFNPQTKIQFAMARTGRVTLRVYNILGQEVRTLVAGVKETGIHEVTWDGKNNYGQNVASGMYVYHLATESFSQAKKLMYVK